MILIILATIAPKNTTIVGLFRRGARREVRREVCRSPILIVVGRGLVVKVVGGARRRKLLWL
jgi:hypothetical protein